MKLFEPFDLRGLTLPNRIVMAPMTRNRANGTVPADISIPYYAARASAGLIVSEAAQVSPRGQGYRDTPGIYDAEQTAAWKRITDAVHACGGRIFVQLYHVGRLSHSDYHGSLPAAPSALPPPGFVRTPEGTKEYEIPHQLSTSEAAGVVDEFAHAARNARDAGFDGIELHGGHGFLIDQFLQSGTNRRTDRYGGSTENRARFALEIVEAIRPIWDRIAFAVSPGGNHKGIRDDDPIGTFSYLARRLSNEGIALLHVMEQPVGSVSPTELLRGVFRGALLSSEGYTLETAEEAVSSGTADLVAFGRAYTANHDLAERFRDGRPVEWPDPSTFYTGGPRGYIDDLPKEFVERFTAPRRNGA